jgi:hypothetical protein
MESVRLETFDLAPDEKDHKITVTIPAAVWPYVAEWFKAKVAHQEKRSSFLLRLILERALTYREQQLIGDFQQTIQNALEEEEATYRERVNATRASLTAMAAGSTTTHTETTPETGSPGGPV